MDDEGPEIGTVVMVFAPEDGKTPIGMGRYLGEERIDVEDDDSDEILFSFNNPKIVLDDGEIIFGIDCWWCPA